MASVLQACEHPFDRATTLEQAWQDFRNSNVLPDVGVADIAAVRVKLKDAVTAWFRQTNAEQFGLELVGHLSRSLP